MLLFGAKRRFLAGVGVEGGNARFLGHNLSCFLAPIWARTYEGQGSRHGPFTIRAGCTRLCGIYTPSSRRSDGTTRPEIDFHAGSRGSSRRRTLLERAAGPPPGDRHRPLVHGPAAAEAPRGAGALRAVYGARPRPVRRRLRPPSLSSI